MITFTRCSSMPSAETFVKPKGSTSRTRPSSASSPPQRSMMTRWPGSTLTASADSRSTTISRLRESPISTSGAPAGTTVSLCSMRRRTWPFTGARIETQTQSASDAVVCVGDTSAALARSSS